MKLILALLFVALTTVVYAYPLDGERREGNVQLNDDDDDDAAAFAAAFAAIAENDDVAKRVGKSIV